MKLTEMLEAIELLRKEGWIVEPPAKGRTAATRVSQPKRVGRPPKNGRRKRRRPQKKEN